MIKTVANKTIDAWVKLSRVQTHILNEINNSLKIYEFPSLSWYDVLLELERVGPAGLRQFEIGSKILLPKHNLSRLIDRLEKEGLVERHVCIEDGRGIRVRLTPNGAELRKSMWPVYAEGLKSAIELKLTAEQIQALDDILGSLLGAPQNTAIGRDDVCEM